MAQPSLTFVAPLVRAALATLEAGLPDQVAAFNAQPENDVVLTAPQTYVFGALPLLSSVAHPIVECAGVSGDLGNFTIRRETADHDLRINVAVWAQGQTGDVPALYEETLGLIRCIVEVLTPVGGFGPGVELANDLGVSWRCDVIPADLTAASQEAGRTIEAWRGSGLLQFRVEPLETFL
jgi:hypothetical protein